MKILFVTPRFPYPPLKGDQVVPYHRLRFLGLRHEVTLLSLYEDDAQLEGIESLRPFCKVIHTVRLPRWKSVLNMALRGSFSDLPFQVLYYRSPDFQRALDGLLRDNDFDVIHAFLLRSSPYLAQTSIPRLLELIDSMQLNFERRVAMERGPKKWLFREELRRVATLEKSVGKLFDHLTVVAEKDRECISTPNVTVIPNGVDTDLFSRQDGIRSAPVIVFAGNMSYAPNIHAALWFAKHAYPLIRQVLPDAVFMIAGGNPPKEVRELAQQPGITVTGFVNSMPAILNQASVAVAPMQSGSGIQNKILEAMACALPVVTTTLGLGGIRATPGEELLVADTPEEFAGKVIMLLTEPETAERIGLDARGFVMANHSWEHAADQVETIYTQILNGRTR